MRLALATLLFLVTVLASPANAATVLGDYGISTTGYIQTSGISTTNISATSITATKLIGDGSLLTNLSGATGDRLTSSTFIVTATPAGSVSLTTGGITWGYLASTVSYLPSLNAGSISTTSISLTNINGQPYIYGISPTSIPAFRAHKNATNQTVTTSTATKLTWSTESFDTYGNFSTATGRFTPTVAGLYHVNLSVYCSGLSSQGACSALLYKNGASLNQGIIRSPAGTVIGTVHDLVYMNGSTDYLEAYVYTEATSGLILGDVNGTNFSASLAASGNGLAGNDSSPSGAITAFDLASCPTGWAEYTAARGRFLRGIDNGAGLDPDGTRAAGATQADDLKSHTHGVLTRDGSGSSPGGVPLGWASGGSNPGVASAGAATATGGTETRPKNVAVLFCRKS